MLRVGQQLGLFERAPTCSVCEVAEAAADHQEIYSRPFASMAVCRSCHFAIHRRFDAPERWQHFVLRHPSSNWVHSLKREELCRADAMSVAEGVDIFAALRSLGRT